ncbi:MAG: metalloregulator ArsR/SmtB family transcription factor [Bacteroidia bacterium]|nr:metalloregulator ArsR/SmtB family transcription factor [Bacteroidia bacterium]
MGASKSDHFSSRHNRLAAMAKALSHPARVAILERVLQSDSCICGDIVDDLPLAQPTVSQHLKEMKNAGLIKGRISGNSICYCADFETLQELNVFLKEVMNKSSQQNNTCC